jgi:predicted NAD-dependent protein-ADP-ribosyltransferase YbiA (DUF1768 family)
MVLSKLDTSIEYNEKKDLYEDDNGYENNIYEIKLKQFKSKFEVSFGRQKLYHIKKNIVFFPIYLLHNGKIIVQIGVVEMTNKIFSKIVEEDDFINLSILNKFEPLLYSFVKDINIEKYSTSQMEDTNKSEKINVDGFETNEESDDSNLEEFLFKKDTTNDIKVEEEKNIISEKIDKLWIHQFMNSDQYNIVDNEGGGDCLFSVIRDAYNGLGWKTTVQKLRIVLSKEVDEKLYKNYKEYYTQIDNNLNEEEKELKLLKEETKLLKEKFKKTNERTLQNSYKEKVKENVIRFEKLKSQREMTKELYKEIQFMKKVKNVENLKKFIQTCDFWADTWAISTLEKILNIKLVILSSESYSSDDIDNVLLCGQMNEIVEKDFEPDYYIIVEYTGDHYKLITYQNNTILKYEHLPEKLKTLILEKCIENSESGLYNKIPEFKELKKSVKKEDEEDSSDKDLKFQENIDYDNSVVFQIYGKSNDKPLPGKGSGEKIEMDQIKEYSELSKNIDWRRKLSDYHMAPIKIDNYTWNSVVHYMNGNKFKSNLDYYKEFTMESNSVISSSPEKAKEAGQIKSKIRPKDIKIDSDYDVKESELLLKAYKNKFEQHEELKDILKLTKKATIKNYIKGKEAQVNYELMKTRDIV